MVSLKNRKSIYVFLYTCMGVHIYDKKVSYTTYLNNCAAKLQCRETSIVTKAANGGQPGRRDHRYFQVITIVELNQPLKRRGVHDCDLCRDETHADALDVGRVDPEAMESVDSPQEQALQERRGGDKWRRAMSHPRRRAAGA